MTRFMARIACVAVALVIAMTGFSPARAASGTLALAPAQGTVNSAIHVDTDGPCPSGDYFHIFVTGAGLNDKDNIITGATELAGMPRTSDHSVYTALSSTLRNFFSDHGVAKPLGAYTITLRCRAALDFRSLGDFTGVITLDKSGHYAAQGPAARPFSAPDGGGALGGNAADATPGTDALSTSGSATSAPNAADSSSTGAGQPGAAAPGTGSQHVGQSPGNEPSSPARAEAAPARRINLVVVVLLPLLVVLLAGLVYAVVRRGQRTDSRPDVRIQQRKVPS